MAGLGDIFGKESIAGQFLIWGVANQIAQALLQPTMQLVLQEIFSVEPTTVLTPAELADMVVRNIYTEAEAAGEAVKSGIDPARFHAMVLDTGEPPGLEMVLEMWRRKIIAEGPDTPGAASVDAAIRTSRLRNEWAEAIKASRNVPISPADAVGAVLRGQIPHAEGQEKAYANGVTPEDFQILLNSAGRPPSPIELAEFVRRGFIPMRGTGPEVLSFQQGIYEGDTKDKWEPIYEKLTEYIPPPRTVTALEREGAITPEQAQKLYHDAGLPPELAAAYAKAAQMSRTATNRQLAAGSVLTLYETRALTQAQATERLTKLGFHADDIALELSLVDFQREIAALNSAKTRIGTAYITHKITKAAATKSLEDLGAPAEHVAHLLSVWDTERMATIRQLTPAQIIKAWEVGALTEAEASDELVAIGYTPFDAWILLSNAAKTPQTPRPARGVTGPGVLP